jgi:hypothetical protein
MRKYMLMYKYNIKHNKCRAFARAASNPRSRDLAIPCPQSAGSSSDRGGADVVLQQRLAPGLVKERPGAGLTGTVLHSPRSTPCSRCPSPPPASSRMTPEDKENALLCTSEDQDKEHASTPARPPVHVEESSRMEKGGRSTEDKEQRNTEEIEEAQQRWRTSGAPAERTRGGRVPQDAAGSRDAAETREGGGVSRSGGRHVHTSSASGCARRRGGGGAAEEEEEVEVVAVERGKSGGGEEAHQGISPASRYSVYLLY